MIEYRTGNLLEATDLPAIAHGCNCQGVMGSGIAKTIGGLYPMMYDLYKKLCEAEFFYLGGIFPYMVDESYMIYNLGTQDKTGPNADLIAIAVSVRRMVALAHQDGIHTIGIPRIGAGIGGLDWPSVEHALEVASYGSQVTLIVHTLPEEEAKFCAADHNRSCCNVTTITSALTGAEDAH